MTDQRIYNVLFLCVGNSARSIMAESILNVMGQGRFAGFSAGSEPRPAPMPEILAALAIRGYPTEMLRSKSWQEFTGPHAPPLDFVITLCDEIRNDPCPRWSGEPLTTHWGMIDPARYLGQGDPLDKVIDGIAAELEHRIRRFCELPIDVLEKLALNRRLEEIAAEGLSSALPSCRLP